LSSTVFWSILGEKWRDKPRGKSNNAGV
jgi:hypothetical protein